MKRLLLAFVILSLTTSFIELPKRYWLGVSCFNGNKEEWIIPKVIESSSREGAKRIYNNHLKINRNTNGRVMVSYEVFEVEKDDILK